jgi:hypothetical protein
MAIKYKKPMTDQEARLFDVYLTQARWDKRDTERFGIVENLSVRDIKAEFLPNWSVGKISEVGKSLVEKKFLAKLPKNRICVNNFWIYQATVLKAEQGFQCLEQQVQPTEQNIRQNEQQASANLQAVTKNLVDKFRVSGI